MCFTIIIIVTSMFNVIIILSLSIIFYCYSCFFFSRYCSSSFSGCCYSYCSYYSSCCYCCCCYCCCCCCCCCSSCSCSCSSCLINSKKKVTGTTNFCGGKNNAPPACLLRKLSCASIEGYSTSCWRYCCRKYPQDWWLVSKIF